MNWTPADHSPVSNPLNEWYRRGVRLLSRAAIAFGLSTVGAVLLAGAVSDNGFVQIVVTIFAALALWPPLLILTLKVDRLFTRRPKAEVIDAPVVRREPNDSWHRLLRAAPAQSERIAVLQRSLQSSRSTLGIAQLDPDAKDLCVLIDRRLPQLIDRELDSLPPDDVHRRRQLDELVDLIEQFARHCGRKHMAESDAAQHEAAILRRRFEARLSEF